MKCKLLFIFFFVLISSLFSQVKNINSLQGTWIGEWINDHFQSTGSAQIMMVVDESQSKAIATFNIGGFALGVPVNVFVEEAAYTAEGAEITITHEVWGDVTGTLNFATGEINGTADNNPVNQNVGLMTGAGILTSDSLMSTFTMVYNGIGTITGGMELVKENAISFPTDLTAVENTPGTVELSWIVTSSNHTGFKIDRWSASERWVEIADLGINDVSYSDNSVDENTDYKYRVAAYNAETESEFSNEAEITTITDVRDEKVLYDFALGQNYPNPFNPATKIKFSVRSFSPVKVEVFNQTGELVSTLFDGHLKGGEYEVNFNAQDFASGIYYYRMSANNFISTRKMILLK
jgi:hypothetical protein